MVRWGQVIRTILGVLLIPLCVAAAVTFGRTALFAEAKGWHVWVALLAGVGAYTLLFVFFHKSLGRLFFSKEPVTLMWSTVTGYRLPALPADQKGARYSEPPTDVKGRRVPLWAVLVQYLIPLYTIVGVLAVWIAHLVLGGRFAGRTYAIVQAFVIAFTYTFHLFIVCTDIREKSTHLRAAGYVFTLALMFLVNIEIIAALGMLVFKGMNWLAFNEQLYVTAQKTYAWFWQLNYNPFA